MTFFFLEEFYEKRSTRMKLNFQKLPTKPIDRTNNYLQANAVSKLPTKPNRQNQPAVHMLNDAAEMFSNSAKHLFGIYMLFVIMLYLCIQW